ncbi:Hint domain-containing protein [Pseudooctadecabacter jejudonensis]|uniref:Hemolysin, plasmid n=1 Tax=Pseudooctadecabacter jejudonensis TaxID=1391910 RepID=A0A1Y5RGB2_9RHOB|nr:Hint domain-containing protein [Pseudooctadecabacter jejudonensis]SLN16604.1 Hemolysin, plasmid [Pseudooctadecabacter jejudonensis]
MAREFGTNGDDTLTGGNDADQLFGGDGDDTLRGGNNSDRLFGGSGDDTLEGDRGGDRLFGGSGNDSIDGGEGSDRIDAGDGDDTIFGGVGQDLIFGGAGNDFIDGDGPGGNEQSDRIFGGAGDDTIIGDGNQDQLFGGSGNDQFIVSNDGTNFNNILVDGGENGGDLDILDLSEFFAQDPDTQIIFEDGGPGEENGRILLRGSDGREFGRITFRDIEEIRTDPICFVPGTWIATPNGQRRVEDLVPGDMVFTRDNGLQTVQWTGARTMTRTELMAQPNFHPILIRAGALGQGLPEQDLMVSPNHRVLLMGERAALYFEENEVLSSAKYLVGTPGIERITLPEVRYIHVMFERHEVILSNGAWTESFQAGAYGMSSLDGDQRREVFTLFPELANEDMNADWAAARRILKRHEVQVFTA